MITVPTPPFVRDGLTALFGFPVPAPFVAVLNTLCHDCESAEAACDRVNDALGWLLAGDERRYTQTPPELFPIAATCVDGGHFGYVIHAPELGAADYPIARFEPMDNGGAYLLGTSTFEAVETHGRAAEVGRELPAGEDMAALRAGHEFAGNHVVDHALAQRGTCVTGRHRELAP